MVERDEGEAVRTSYGVTAQFWCVSVRPCRAAQELPDSGAERAEHRAGSAQHQGADEAPREDGGEETGGEGSSRDCLIIMYPGTHWR